MLKVFWGFAVLAALSVVISLGGQRFGHAISLSGHTDDTTLHEIVIGNDVVVAAANEIRFERDRRAGMAARLDLYLRWPELEGYREEARDDFNHAGGSRRILFLSLEPRSMSRDMSGRLAPIYRSLIVPVGTEGPGGVMVHAFTSMSGYLNEVLAVAERKGETAFVARCLSGPSAEESLTPCERDIQVGEDLSLTYRFPRDLLSDWPKLEAAVRAKAATMVKTDG